MNLPDGWELRTSPEYPGRVFYFNKDCHECTWIRPLPYPGLSGAWPPMVSVVELAIFHGSGQRTPEDAFRRINDIYRRITEGISSFEDVATMESDLKSQASIWICRGEKPRDYERVAWRLDIGELSEPFELGNRYLILVRTG
jgi:NIMA-interacting peptidyl-prolyl cis-trans isomerase 1